MKKLLSALFVLALCSSVAMASVPDPSNCEVTNIINNGVLVVPDQSGVSGPYGPTILGVTVRNSANNPIPNAIVEVDLHSNIALCSSFVNTATTNANGFAQITLAAAGCVHNTASAAVIRANGLIIRTVANVKSPANGQPDANLPLNEVGLAAAVVFSDAFNGVSPQFQCMDMTNSGECGIGDAIFFSDCFNAAYSCTLP